MPRNDKPNILILWGDDIGWWNISYNSRGQMGYRTPNIDRIAQRGRRLHRLLRPAKLHGGPRRLHHRAEPDPHRPDQGRHAGRRCRPPRGRPDHRRTAEAAGLRHRPVRQEPSGRSRTNFCPPCTASTSSSATSTTSMPKKNPRTRIIRRTRHSSSSSGPGACCTAGRTARAGRRSRTPVRSPRSAWRPSMTKSRTMPSPSSTRCHKEGKPFFIWYNTTAMHFRTHCAEKHKGKSGQGDYNDVMVAHDENIGRMLDKLDELGIADDTIVMYSTDNGPHYNSWPDAGITPFRAEKNTNWEGGWRVPAFVRWPGKIKPGTVLNDICSPTRIGCRLFWPRRASRTSSEKLLEGPQGRRQDLQGPHRRLQPAPLPDRRGEGEPAQVLLLHQRRRRHPGAAHGRLEDGADGAAREATDVLVRAVREAARAENVQPAPRSVRAGGRKLEHLLGLGDLPRLPALRDAGDRRPADPGLREIPAASEAGRVQPRRGDCASSRTQPAAPTIRPPWPPAEPQGSTGGQIDLPSPPGRRRGQCQHPSRASRRSFHRRSSFARPIFPRSVRHHGGSRARFRSPRPGPGARGGPLRNGDRRARLQPLRGRRKRGAGPRAGRRHAARGDRAQALPARTGSM